MSTGFSFGANTATPTFGAGTSTFGAPAAQQPPKFGFGSPAASTAFGSPATASTFGAPAAAPTFGAPSTGFGASPAPNTGFSLGSTSFGPPAANTAPSFGFGATPAAAPQATGLSFGAAPAASTGLSFGAPASNTSSLTFGAQPTNTLSFGSTPAASTGLSFGAAPAASTGLNFSAPASSAGGLTFGASNIGTPATGLSFGTTTATPSCFAGLNFTTTTTTSAPTLGLNFGQSTTTTPSLGLSFSASTAAPTFNLGATSTSAAPSFGLGGTSTGLTLTTATTQPQSVGLGGIAQTQSKTGTSTSQKEIPPKEQLLPNEFVSLVENFKSVVQEEKKRSSDVARSSIKEFCKVETDLDVLTQQFNQVETNLQTNRSLAEKLKFDTAKGLQNIEMAQATQDTPPSMQYNHTAPLQFFIDLADSFEKEMQALKLKIESTDKFVRKCNVSNVLTSQDLAKGMKRLHETFVALAGRMQSVHNQVETQKEHFLNVRKQNMKDATNPFESGKNSSAMESLLEIKIKSPPNLSSGPTPFNSFALGSNNITLTLQQNQPPPPAYPGNAPTMGFGLGNTSFGSQPFNTSLNLNKPTAFGTGSLFGGNTTQNFQLQKPPTGNKRATQSFF